MENKFNDDLEKRIFKKLEKKIAIENFKTKEKKKFHSYAGIKIASILIVSAMILGNAFSYATDNENIFSWILNKIGIFREYDEEKNNVNITKESNGISLTLTDYGIDKNTLIIGYNLKLDQKEEFIEKLFNNSKIVNGTDVYGLEDKNTELFYKVSDTEYNIYELYTIDASKLGNNACFESKIQLIKESDNPDISNIFREWEFKINLDKDKITLDYDEFNVENKTVTLKRLDGNEDYHNPKASIIRVKRSKLTTKLVVLIEDYATAGVAYFVEVKDENGKTLLENNNEYGIGGVPTDIMLKRIEFDSKISVNFYETNVLTKEIYYKGTIELDLGKDLIEKEEKTISKVKKNWRNLEFEYNKDYEIHTDISESVIREKPISYSFMIHMFDKINNTICTNGVISGLCYKNQLNYNLEQVFETKRKLDNFSLGLTIGKYYIINTHKEGYDGYLEATITHEQMMDLLDGKDITAFSYMSSDMGMMPAGDVTFNKKDFWFQNTKFENERKTKIDNVDAITYTVTFSDTTREYLFIYDGYIYEISCPTEFEVEEDVKEFIDSIKIK